MTRWRDDDLAWDEDTDPDREIDDDLAEDEEEPTVPCPYCGDEVHEDAQRCPSCERYISREDAPPGRKPLWLIVGVVACLYVVYRWIVWW
jgi:hypothetical protein